MSRPIITLTTDFGTGSPYVAQMKGVIFSINPDVEIVDVTHGIAAQDVREGALVLEEVTTRFPDGTVHVCVVDPGVGTERKIVYAQIGVQRYIAPDNGLLSWLATAKTPAQIIALTNRDYWLPKVSSTFHGRDIIAPAAAHLSLGTSPEKLGEPIDRLTMLEWPKVVVEAKRIVGSVISVDSFGNLISNIDLRVLADVNDLASVAVTCGGKTTDGIVETYGRRAPDSLIALLGSSGKLEVAIVGGSAAQLLGAAIGDTVTVVW